MRRDWGTGISAARVAVPDDPPELQGLARSFNATAERLEALVRSQQAFVADASHQLRTPLAALSLRLENLEAEGPELRVDDLHGAQRRGAASRPARRGAAPPGARGGSSGADRSRSTWSPCWKAGTTRGARWPRSATCSSSASSRPARCAASPDASSRSSTTSSATRSTSRRRARVSCWGHGATVTTSGSRSATPARACRRAASARVRPLLAGRPDRRRAGGFGLGLAIVGRLVAADGGTVDLEDAPEGGLAVVVLLPASVDRVGASV